MGASLVIREYNYTGRKELEALVAEQTQQDAYENGSSYSGYWNMCRGPLQYHESKVFDSVSAAHDYIGEHHDKWSGLLAVPAWQELELPADIAKSDTALQELIVQVTELRQRLWNQGQAIVARARQSKSKFKGCSHCDSRINLTHVSQTQCPVCRGNLLRTATDDKQKSSWEDKLKALETRVGQRRTKLVQQHFKLKDPVRKLWVVGGWCAS